MFLSLLAEALERAGRVDEGLAIVDEGFAHAESTLEHGFRHELTRVRGAIFQRQGRAAEAEAAFRASIEIARNTEARSFELRAATSLARLLKLTGRGDEGRALLQPVYAWFTEGQDTADLVAARAAIE